MSKVISIISGKGGVGKTTTSVNIATGLSLKGYKTVIIDFDMGLSNVDLVLGCSAKVKYNFCDVVNNNVTIKQALIQKEDIDNLSVLAASDTIDDCALTIQSVEKIINELKKEFDFIICDAPAGIEQNALMSIYFADDIIIVVNPEISSIRDSMRLMEFIKEKITRNVKLDILITRYIPTLVEKGDMLSIDDVKEILELDIIGVISESSNIIKSSNIGMPVINLGKSEVQQCYEDLVLRILGNKVEMRFVEENTKDKIKRWLKI
ncbi:Septum site-determining protein MinD [hydrothermal vent metagenome]|uniref:Septum site-determining protein MinD n=1 Tax=hydrothermal vent metagenome TaxID=652676 RepID=A0A1W1CIL7_9ZZZZ